MTRPSPFTLLALAVAFAAGVLVARTWLKPPPVQPPSGGGSDGTWLTSQLNLRPDQRDALRQIWSEHVSTGAERTRRRDALMAEREQTVRNMLAGDQQEAYDRLLREQDGLLQAVQFEYQQSRQAAEQKTRQVLDANQQQTFERIIAEFATHDPKPPAPTPVGGHPTTRP